MQDSILDYLTASSDLVALAKTARVLSERPLKRLYRNIPDVNVLFYWMFNTRYKPHQPFIVSLGVSIAYKIAECSRQWLNSHAVISPEQWIRFNRVSKLVKHIAAPIKINDMSSEDLNRVQRSLHNRPPSGIEEPTSLIPNLTSLTIVCEGNHDLTCYCVIPFLSASLVSCTISFSQPTHSHIESDRCPIFRKLQEGALPALKALTLRAAAPPPQILDPIHPLFPVLQCLDVDEHDEVVELQGLLIPTSITAIAEFSSLTQVYLRSGEKNQIVEAFSLALPQDALPHLQAVGGDLGVVATFLRDLDSAANFRTVEIFDKRNRLKNRSLGPFSAVIATVASTCLGLRRFRFEMRTSGHGRDLINISNVKSGRRGKSDMIRFRPLSTCSQLKEFSAMLAYEACDLDDAVLRELATSWPQLQCLEITGSKGRYAPNYTLRTLAGISEVCPEIQSMTMWIICNSASDERMQPFPRIRRLRFAPVWDSRLRGTSFQALQCWAVNAAEKLGYACREGESVLFCAETDFISDHSDTIRPTKRGASS